MCPEHFSRETRFCCPLLVPPVLCLEVYISICRNYWSVLVTDLKEIAYLSYCYHKR